MSIDGTWKISVSTPMGAQQMTARLTTAGDKVTGRIEATMGSEDISGSTSGDSAKWSMKVTQPMPIQLDFDIKVDGDAMSGTVKLGMFGNGALAGTRA